MTGRSARESVISCPRPCLPVTAPTTSRRPALARVGQGRRRGARCRRPRPRRDPSRTGRGCRAVRGQANLLDAGTQPLQTDVERDGPLLHEPIGVEHERVARTYGDLVLDVAVRDAPERRAGLVVEAPRGPVGRDQQRRRVTRRGDRERRHRRVVVGDQERRELPVQQHLHVRGEPGQEPCWAVALQGQRRDDGPQLAHPGRAAQAVAHHVARRQQDPALDQDPLYQSPPTKAPDAPGR